jgi:putative ABC transport system permease protein
MNVFSLAKANMRQRLLATILTMLLVAIGVALVHAILTIRDEVQSGFKRGVAGKIHLVIGPKGAPMQLVLNSLFHVSKPLGNLSYSYYENEIKSSQKVKLAIPIAVGDSYKGLAVVGTTPEFLTQLELANEQTFKFEQGGAFKEHFEAVLGAEAARQTGLKIGDEFHPTHGMEEQGSEHHEEFKVVGILEPTGTPHDRALYCDIETVHDMHGKITGRPISAILVVLHSDLWVAGFAREINDGKDATAAMPAIEIRDLMNMVSNANKVLIYISWLVLFAAGVSILVSIYNSMSERRREIAIIRALGAPAAVVFQIIVIEAATICFIGGLAGLAASHLTVLFGRAAIHAMTGVVIGPAWPGLQDLALLGGAILIGILSSLIPAVSAYKTDIATNIRPTA